MSKAFQLLNAKQNDVNGTSYPVNVVVGVVTRLPEYGHLAEIARFLIAWLTGVGLSATRGCRMRPAPAMPGWAPRLMHLGLADTRLRKRVGTPRSARVVGRF